MSTTFTNEQIANLLREVAAAYEVKGESFFKIRAYGNVAASVEHASTPIKDLWSRGKLSEIPGIGPSIESYLDELFRTGRVQHFDEVRENLPQGMFRLLDIPGVGPKTAYKLAQTLKVENVEDLRRAAERGQIREISGFGEKTEQEIIQGIEEFAGRTQRMLLPVASEIAEEVQLELLKVKGVRRVDPLGSLRRQLPTIGDLDLAVAVDDRSSNAIATDVIQTFVNLSKVGNVLNHGQAEASVVWFNGKQIDLRVQDEASYGALLQHFTGSKQHNIHLRQLALDRGLSLSERGIKKLKSKKSQLIKFKTEKEFYNYLGMDWIAPEIREDTGEIEAALNQKLPKLVELSDIKGDLHAHCDFDLEESHDAGRSSIADFAQAGISLGYEYIAIGNHSPSVYNHSSEQMIALIRAKQKAINVVQKSFPQIKLLNEVEVDILADGRLAIPDEGLKILDVVIVSIHSSMQQSKSELTKRVISALENPYTHVLGHPTGRLLDSRSGYELDWSEVFAVARKYNKAIEINSFYNRLDLPDVLVREAVNSGVKLVINTDAHAIDHLNLMRYGVGVARRGWAEKKDIINASSWVSLHRFLSRA